MIEVQRVDFIAVPTQYLERADRFYGETLGIPSRPSCSACPTSTTARATLEEAGVEFTMATFDSGACNGAAFSDPDGNGLMLHRRYAPYADGSTP